ncbi:MAG: cytochrome c-type biogenesis protein CcmH [Alphaproteobacteria bacterium]|nr:cytochrome c-type biogenesis protein CcmH [Alphaproteobacteria bacterium]
MRQVSLVPGLALAAALVLGPLMAPPSAALAVQPDEVLADAKLESRARNLSKHLRCLVCQNQSIDDSDAGLARDLRILVRERLKAGDTDEEVLAFLVARYGDFVLLKPPVKPTTWLLWFGPFAVFAVAGLGIWAASRRKAPAAAPAEPLDAAERQKLATLLGRDDGPEPGPPEGRPS